MRVYAADGRPRAARAYQAIASFLAIKLLLDLIREHRVEIVRDRDLSGEEAEPLNFAGNRSVERDHFDQRFAGFGDHERLAFGGTVDQPREMGLGFVDVDGSHRDLLTKLNKLSPSQRGLQSAVDWVR